MKKFITYVALGIVIVIGIGLFLYMGGSSTSRFEASSASKTTTTNVTPSAQTQTTSKKTPTSNTTAPAQTGAKTSTSPRAGFTMTQVAQHNSQNSCYSAVNGNVYDLTSFIDAHPGGAGSILSMCGVDGTTAFMNMHGGQGRPEAELASLKIGVLIQ